MGWRCIGTGRYDCNEEVSEYNGICAHHLAIAEDVNYNEVFTAYLNNEYTGASTPPKPTEYPTFNEFVKLVRKKELENLKTLRRGQVIFNLLAEHRPDIAELLRGGMDDPYYVSPYRADEILYEVIQSLWY
jgi:hypothetical protein